MNDSPILASRRDLVEAAGVAVRSTIGNDGYPQATSFVLDPANPYRALEIRRDVTFDDDADEVFLQRLVARYGQTGTTPPDRDEASIVLQPLDWLPVTDAPACIGDGCTMTVAGAARTVSSTTPNQRRPKR